ncbi:unnamed protein product [Albugo candida]|uniref:Uncharacterized protein n=1 Tax=Albugo candida TaxID=65357 RepID=A0A024GVR5_9STRA|nr:unnamed protein product [Albugo candida]|eukprot:CCI50785.1 unnamed protein product [Albugo candida]
MVCDLSIIIKAAPRHSQYRMPYTIVTCLNDSFWMTSLFTSNYHPLLRNCTCKRSRKIRQSNSRLISFWKMTQHHRSRIKHLTQAASLILRSIQLIYALRKERLEPDF